MKKRVLVTYNMFRAGYAELIEKYDVTFPPEGRESFTYDEVLDMIEDYDVLHLNDSQGEHGSHVAGIATANRLDPLSPVLKDRLDIVQLPPYKPVDKKRIVEKHMWPRLIVEYKLDCLDYLVDPLQETLCHPEALRLEEDAVEEMIRRCPEEGVRNLERLCRKLCESVIGTYYATGELVSTIDKPTMERLLEPIYYK